MKTVIEPPRQATIPVRGTDAVFPVHRIYCVGRNYAAHAIEMGHDPNAEPPFFFTKPADAVVQDGATIPFPAPPTICTTRPSWSLPSALAGRRSRPTTRFPMSLAMPPGTI